MKLVIREAEPQDAAALLDYLKRVGGETDNLLFDGTGVPLTVDQEAAFLATLKSAERSAMLVVLLAEQIVAVGQLSTRERARIAHQGSLAISVLREYWGQGVGSALLAALIELAKQFKVTVVRLEVRADNDRAIALYEKFGFQAFGTFKKYICIDGTYYDVIFMNLYLEEEVV